MNYQSLYRKYRPTTFSEVFGQPVAKQILKNAIETQKIAHAYLFFGPRGTGKTSLAKMFARMCNCLNPVNGECCNTCENCIESQQKNCVDIIEIDAASNNGVDEIRDLKNRINLVSSKLKYKVYIVDEVHMLSTGAFNALLKTLEEPPSHVIFILATTEFYKVPETIVSRCQCIEFKNIDDLSMYNRLKIISENEKISIEDEAINEIVRNSNGGLRDAIGLLDKVNSYSIKSNLISVDDVRNVLGLITRAELYDFLQKMMEGKQEELLSKIKEYSESGKDIYKIINDLIFLLRNIIVEEKKYGYIKLLNKLNDFQKNITNSYNQKIMFEIFVIEWSIDLRSTGNNINDEKTSSPNVIAKIEESKNIIDEDKSTNHENDDYIKELSKIRINNAFVNANKEDLKECKNIWKKIESFSFDKKIGSIICDLLDTDPVLSNKDYLVICSQYSGLTEKINNNIKKYENVFYEVGTINKKIVAVDKEQWDFLKKDYVNKLKAGYKYELIDEKNANNNKNQKSEDNELYDKALNLFGEIVKEDN